MSVDDRDKTDRRKFLANAEAAGIPDKVMQNVMTDEEHEEFNREKPCERNT